MSDQLASPVKESVEVVNAHDDDGRDQRLSGFVDAHPESIPVSNLRMLAANALTARAFAHTRRDRG